MSSIVSTELKFYRAANQSDLSSNGGRMSASLLASGVVGALFPNIDDTERTAGSTKYRKVFYKVDHNGPESLLSPRVFQDANTGGDDRVTFFPGSQTDTQASITGSERQYGCGALTSTVSSGVSSIQVTVETGTTGIFQVGDTIRITDKATVGATGNEEFVTVSSASQVGSVVTLGFSPVLANGYSSSLTRVASIYSPGDQVANASALVVTSAAGTYNTTTNPLVLNDKSTIEQTWTLTFTSATAFTISGDTLGAVGSGTVSGGASPTNTDFSLPYFTLSAGGFGGTYVAADTIVFTTHPAAVPLWIKRVVPAGAAVSSASTATFAMDGGAA